MVVIRVQFVSLKGPATLFLPSDEAFATLPKEVLDQLEENPELLRQVLLYHATTVEISPSAQSDSYIVPTMEGTPLVISMLRGGKVIIIGGAKAMAVTRANNGVFYVIDQLLYPLPHPDIVGAVQSRPDLSILSSLISQSGLNDLLTGDAPHTFLAPTDNAFAQLPNAVYQELTQNMTALQEILKNHIIKGAHYGREFYTGPTFPSARGRKLKFKAVSYGYQVNEVNVKTPEIVTGSGVIHLIDKVLIDDADLKFLNIQENSLAGGNSVTQGAGQGLSGQSPASSTPSPCEPTLSSVQAQSLSNGSASNIIDLAKSMGLDGFVIWITKTGLLEKIQDGGEYTVFTPTDDAVNALPQYMLDFIVKDPIEKKDKNPELDLDEYKPASKEQMKSLLQYHIIPRMVNMSSLRNEEIAPTLVKGMDIRFNVYQAAHNCTQVVTATGSRVLVDKMVTMGSIQLIPIERVLYRPTCDLMCVLEDIPILLPLSMAMRQSDTKWMLREPGPLTFFVPHGKLFETMNRDEQLSLKKTTFRDLMRRHLVKGTIFSSGVLEDLEKKNLNNQTLKISRNQGGMTINSANVLYSDISATNGVLHVIDKIIQ